MTILDPNNASDNNAYTGINDLLNANLTNAEIDGNPLFRAAENFIVGLIAAAALPGGRTYTNRAQIISALQFLFMSYELEAGGSSASTTAGSGAVKSRTESFDGEQISISYDVGVTSKVSRTADDRAKWYQDQAYAILKSLGANVDPSDISGDTDATVTLTRSRL